MDYVCASCNSDNIQRLSAVFANGTANITARTNGTAVGFSGGHLGVAIGSAKTTGSSQTLASQQAAPPKKRTYVKPLLLIMLGGPIVGSQVLPPVISLFLWPIASLLWIGFAFRYNKTTWPVLMESWQSAFLCHRCGALFRLEA